MFPRARSGDLVAIFFHDQGAKGGGAATLGVRRLDGTEIMKRSLVLLGLVATGIGCGVVTPRAREQSDGAADAGGEHAKTVQRPLDGGLTAMQFHPAEFQAVPINTITQSSCSPHVDDRTFRGMAIRVPDRIVAGEGERVVLPICGYYQIGTASVIAGADIHVHVRNASDPQAKPISGKVVPEPLDEHIAPPPDRGPIDPKRYENQISQSYFNYDAQRYLPPLAAGTYEVSVSYGPHRSNVARVVIARP
jgi:hypothetical protein